MEVFYMNVYSHMHPFGYYRAPGPYVYQPPYQMVYHPALYSSAAYYPAQYWSQPGVHGIGFNAYGTIGNYGAGLHGHTHMGGGQGLGINAGTNIGGEYGVGLHAGTNIGGEHLLEAEAGGQIGGKYGVGMKAGGNLDGQGINVQANGNLLGHSAGINTGFNWG
jgi:hypothetical protein